MNENRDVCADAGYSVGYDDKPEPTPQSACLQQLAPNTRGRSDSYCRMFATIRTVCKGYYSSIITGSCCCIYLIVINSAVLRTRIKITNIYSHLHLRGIFTKYVWPLFFSTRLVFILIYKKRPQ